MRLCRGVVENEFPVEWVNSEKAYRTVKDRMESIGKVHAEIVRSPFPPARSIRLPS